MCIHNGHSAAREEGEEGEAGGGGYVSKGNERISVKKSIEQAEYMHIGSVVPHQDMNVTPVEIFRVRLPFPTFALRWMGIFGCHKMFEK